MGEPSRTTAAVRAGIGSDKGYGSVVPPIYMSTNYVYSRPDADQQYDYSRSQNPTRNQFAAALAKVEGGAGATVTATGLGAITLSVLACLRPGDLLIAPHDCYGGTWRLLAALADKGCFRLEMADLTTPAGVEAAIALRPRMVWIETPSNPLLRITDVVHVVQAARTCDALVAVDNTFLSPVLQQPLALGADIVVHSGTKYINGHSDVVIGAVIAATDELHADLTWWANCLGITASAFDSYLALRGLRTIHARVSVHQQNAREVVAALSAHPAVAQVFYPGLPTHPGHEVASRQASGFGAMVSCELVGGRPAVDAFLTGLRWFSLAESLGGVESLVAHPSTMTHASMPPDLQATAGITQGLLRFSVGIEDPADLVGEITAGLDRAAAIDR